MVVIILVNLQSDQHRLRFFNRQDILQLALDLNVPVPEIYGKIERQEDGTLYTTKAQRTGCSMCGFGLHLEKAPSSLTYLKSKILKSGSIGCITAAQMIKQAKDTAGQGCWIISMLNINCNCKEKSAEAPQSLNGTKKIP